MAVDKRNADAQVDPVLLDRLVDNELTDTERRSVLSALELETDGWRRCALAFLEAQTWRAAARSASLAATDPLARGTDVVASTGQVASADAEAMMDAVVASVLANQTPVPSGPSVPFAGDWQMPWRWMRRGALAAGIVLAFGLGVLLSRWGSSPNGSSGDGMTIAQPTVVATSEPGAPGMSVGERTDPAAEASRIPPKPSASQLARTGAPDGVDESIIPKTIQQLLEESGHRVYERRGFVSMAMDDGSQIRVPVREVEVVPISHKTY